MIYKEKKRINMTNNIFNFSSKDFKESINIKDIQDADYELISLEFGKPINTYQIRQELYSEAFWKHLKSNYDIDEKHMIIHTDIDVDEKQKTHKSYKYLIRIDINKTDYFYILFYDEERGYSDSDYHDFATDEDKENKINSLTIYYDNNMISFENMEIIVSNMIEYSYLPSNKNQFFTIQTTQYGFQLKASYVKDMEIDLELNYGRKFIHIYDEMFYKLKYTKQGLFLLHGGPGSGKCVDGSTFVTIRNKKTGEIEEISIDDFYKFK